MSDVKWSYLANQHAMITVGTIVLGSVISLAGKFYLWPLSIYALLLGAFVLILEYPRSGKRQLIGRQSIPERAYQFCLAKQFNKMGHLYSNYFPRFILYFALSIPCFFTLSTLIPGLNLMITSCLYLMSNFKKEKWVLIDRRQAVYVPGTVVNSPDRPPPRNISDL